MRNTYLWLFQLVTGGLIAVLLGIHLVLQHLNDILNFFGVSDAEPTSWQSMITRSNQGIWAGLYIALLAFALYHAINGVRNIILELSPSANTERIITWVLITIGILGFAWGTYVPIAMLTS